MQGLDDSLRISRDHREEGPRRGFRSPAPALPMLDRVEAESEDL